jgi:hypothetical protein
MTYGKACLAARAGGALEVVTPDVGVLVDYGNLTIRRRWPTSPSARLRCCAPACGSFAFCLSGPPRHRPY